VTVARATVSVIGVKAGAVAADHQVVVVDLVMGASSGFIGALLIACSVPLADLMKEGDDRWRGHPVFSRFEPTTGPLATDEGRWWALRAWLLLSAVGFVVVGGGLLVRAALAL